MSTPSAPPAKASPLALVMEVIVAAVAVPPETDKAKSLASTGALATSSPYTGSVKAPVIWVLVASIPKMIRPGMTSSTLSVEVNEVCAKARLAASNMAFDFTSSVMVLLSPVPNRNEVLTLTFVARLSELVSVISVLTVMGDAEVAKVAVKSSSETPCTPSLNSRSKK